MFTIITIRVARTITPLFSSYSSIASVFLNCPRRRPSSIFSTIFKPQHSPFSSSSTAWTPQRVNNFGELLRNAQLHSRSTIGDKCHWLVQYPAVVFQFDTEQALFDCYIKSLAVVVGSEVEAKNKIYLVSISNIFFGVGAEIDENTKNKLLDMFRMQKRPAYAIEDVDYGARKNKKDPHMQSALRFIPVNWHRRLDNIFSYHLLSERNLQWDSDYWLINTREPYGINTKEPDVGRVEREKVLNFCINLLGNILGSEREARERIYMIWLKSPFGFAAKVDVEIANQLKDLPDVLKVLPDYTFDVHDSDDEEAILISPPSYGSVLFSHYPLSKESDFEDCVSMEDHVGLSCQNFDSNHWFIRMQNPSAEYASIYRWIDAYIQMLAIVIGNEEAEKKIYRVECGGTLSGFGADIEERTANRVLAVLPDSLLNNSCRIPSRIRCTPINRNHRLNDIFSYHYLSECKAEWSSDHWLVHIRKPDFEIATEQQTIDFIIQLFAGVVGSEKVAKERIYIVWCKTPLGFGAEMDEKTSNKLKDLPDVLLVLPDYAFDIKTKDGEALVISSSSSMSYLKPDWSYNSYLLEDMLTEDDGFDPKF